MPVYVKYDIVEDTFWPASEGPYYICAVDQLYSPVVRPGVTLTIESDTIVYLGTIIPVEFEVYPSPGLVIEGAIFASGTTFTSYPEGNYWESITFSPGSTGNFFGCSFENGGLGDFSEGMVQTGTVESSVSQNDSIEIVISESSFRNGSSSGIYFSDLAAGRLTVASSNFNNLPYAIYVENEIAGSSIINISDCHFEECQLQAISIINERASIINCTVKNNLYTGLELMHSNSTVDRCTFISNSNHGILVNTNSAPVIKNCLMAKNSGSGLTLNSASVILENCTVAGNLGSIAMDFGINCINSTLSVRNCIIYGNTNGDILNNGSDIDVNYSDIGSEGICPGMGNINVEPLFADPDNNNYYLKSIAGRWNRATDTWVADNASSPCIDAGDSVSEYQDEPQPHGGRVNMGFEGNTVYASKSVAAPEYLGVEITSTKKTAMLRFNDEILNNTPNLQTLKDSILYAQDGTNYQSLQPGDSAAITGKVLTVVLQQELKNNANRFKVLSSALKSRHDSVLSLPLTTEPIAISNPEEVYTIRKSVPSTAAVLKVDVVKGEFAVLRTDKTAMFSRNGIDWERLSPAPVEMRSVAYGNGIYAAVGVQGFIYISADRTNWTRVRPVTACALNSVTWNRGRFVAVGDEGTILVSDTGVNWIQLENLLPVRLNSVAAAHEAFFAVGDNGTILRSSTAEEWSEEPTPFSSRLNDIAISPARMVAVGDAGTILSAGMDGVWRAETSPIDDNLRAVAYGNGRFVTAGSIITSSDGSTWAVAAAPVTSALLGAAFANNTFLLGGEGGVLLQSGPVFLQQALTRGVPF